MLVAVAVVVLGSLVGALALAGGTPVAAAEDGVPIAATSEAVAVVSASSAGFASGVRVTDRSLMASQLRTSVPAVVGQQVYTDDGGNVIGARWVYAPGAAPVNSRIDSWLREQFALHAASAGRLWPSLPVAGAPPGGMDVDRGCQPGGSLRPVAELLADREATPLADADGTALVISCDIVLAQGAMLGIRMRASEVRFIGGNPMLVTDHVQTFYADIETGASSEGSELFAPDGAPGVVAALRAAVTAAQGSKVGNTRLSQTLREGVDDNHLFSDAVPLGDGSFVVRIAPNNFEPGRSGSEDPVALEVQLTAEDVAGALSAIGTAADDAAVARAPWKPVEAPGPPRTPCDLVPCIALTFDDGPGDLTPVILDALDAGQASATFFVVGWNVEAHPDLVARMAEAGHTLGNHTFSHLNFLVTPREQIQQSIEATDAAVLAACGLTTAYVRPPWGAFDTREAKYYEHPIAMWSVDSRDWQDPSVAELTKRVNAAASPGAIVLMHDTHAVTAQALPKIVADLTSRGFRLVGLSSLIGPKPIATVTTRGRI